MCVAAAALVFAACLNILFDPFGSFAIPKQGRFEHSARVPILMYHHFGDEGSPEVTISADAFESHIRSLRDAGYTAITFAQLRDYASSGAPLPERPILITIDDGYMSVYDIAYPILRKYGMTATVFIIGTFHGKSLYRDNPYWHIIPHFGDAEAREMSVSGVLSIQSHSYGMHQYEPYEETYREGVLRINGESRAEYAEAFMSDFDLAAEQIENATGARPFVYSYPFGKNNRLTESLLRSMGVSITLTTAAGVSTVVRNAPRTLFRLNRLAVSGDMTADELLAMMQNAL